MIEMRSSFANGLFYPEMKDQVFGDTERGSGCFESGLTLPHWSRFGGCSSTPEF